MLNGALDMIGFIYEMIVYIFKIVLQFFPSPFKEIMGVFIVILLIIFILKFLRVAGNVIENIIGVFT